ncbi:MAG: hypothetical protein Kow0042_28650 [Calditrichia bacterium]
MVIDLSRMPSQGRDLAVHFRMRKGTCHIPILFVSGAPPKVAAIQSILPDATYTSSWENVDVAIKEAVPHQRQNPQVPGSVFAAYQGKSLVQKFGIKPKAKLLLINAPEGFEDELIPLPDGAKIYRDYSSRADLAVWFVYDQQELHEGLKRIPAGIGEGPLWIAWPKKTSELKSNLTQQIVRRAGLAAGWVDYKICSVNQTWSGLLFRRKSPSR